MSYSMNLKSNFLLIIVTGESTKHKFHFLWQAYVLKSFTSLVLPGSSIYFNSIREVYLMRCDLIYLNIKKLKYNDIVIDRILMCLF
ncbi:hypothetical protein MtrunA17_Chr4g0076671 [Medicago truncatula]|uniref:Transmembrane protein n=1 Tax=Medicago truncatula TaxID=3880 RepID=A0A396IHL0_MEDTR|nr:hypothetical protein MtrunA17_Chr4g0076671 [Medicago truncatula]